MSKRTQLIEADFEGVSYQSWPDVERPWKIRGVIETDKSKRYVAVVMNREEAEAAVQQLISMLGLTLTAVETGTKP